MWRTTGSATSTHHIGVLREGNRKTISRAKPLIINRSLTHTSHHKTKKVESHLSSPDTMFPGRFYRMEAAGRWGSRRVKGAQGLLPLHQPGDGKEGEGRNVSKHLWARHHVIWSILTVAPVSGCHCSQFSAEKARIREVK